MYKSPIDISFATQYINDVVTEEENAVVRAVVKCGINVDKDELVKALRYDRDQYIQGYTDARAELIHCKDCVGRESHEQYDGTRWNYCSLIRSVVKDDDFCSWAEPKVTE